MKAVGRDWKLQPEQSRNHVEVQRNQAHINVGIGTSMHEWTILDAREARTLAARLLAMADKAEAYTPDA